MLVSSVSPRARSLAMRCTSSSTCSAVVRFLPSSLPAPLAAGRRGRCTRPVLRWLRPRLRASESSIARRDYASSAAMASLVASQAATTSSESSTKRVAAGVPLDLAAGCFGNAVRADQPDGVDRQLMLARHVAANGFEHLVDFARLMTFDLVDDHQPGLVVHFDAQRRAATGPDGRMALLDRQLDVVGIVVQAVDDDQVLEPTGDEQLAVLEEAQVAGAQERAFARCRPAVRRKCVRSPRGGANSLAPRWALRPRSRRRRHPGSACRFSGLTMTIF